MADDKKPPPDPPRFSDVGLHRRRASEMMCIRCGFDFMMGWVENEQTPPFIETCPQCSQHTALKVDGPH